MDWIDLYNDFIKQCVERQLKLSKIETQIKCPIIENMKLEEESKKVLAEISEKELAEESKTKLEYFSRESLPRSIALPLKLVEVLDASGEGFTIESLDTTNFYFNSIKLSPKTLKDLYDNKYKFAKKF